MLYNVLREICPYSEVFWCVFSRIGTEYGEVLGISPYSVQMWENTYQNNSKYGNFLRSDVLRFQSFSLKHSPLFPNISNCLLFVNCVMLFFLQ